MLQTVTVNGAKVIVPDQNASNGVIHVIDKVLFPLPTGNIPQTVGGRSDLSTLLYAVGQANLTDTLNGKLIMRLLRGDNPRALASGLFPIQADKP